MEGFGQRWRIFIMCYLVFTQPVASLRCYICDTLKTKDCGHPFRILPSEATNCPTGSSCVKFRGVRKAGPSDDEVHRYCSTIYETRGCRMISRNGIEGEACVCTTNLCNSATAPSPLSGVLLILLHSVPLILAR